MRGEFLGLTLEQNDELPRWRVQLAVAMKKNVALRTGRVSMLLYLIPFIICTGVFIALSVIFTVRPQNKMEWDASNSILGLFLVGYYIMSLPSLVAMGREKESGMRGLMFQSGLPRWLHILSWFVVDALLAAVASLVFAITTLRGIFFGINSTSIVVPWLYFFLVLIACTPMNLLCIEIVSSPKVQPIVLFILIFVPNYVMAIYTGNNTSLFGSYILCLVPSIAYHLAANVFTAFFQDKSNFINPDKYGMRLNHFYSTVNLDDLRLEVFDDSFTTDQSIGAIFAMELLGCFIILFIAVSLQILISDGSSGFKWGIKRHALGVMQDTDSDSYFPNKNVEPHSVTEALSLRSGKGVVIQNLVKKFGKFTAVDGFSIDFLHDQVTVLLGPNGAGKTTVVNCLTGFTKRYNGTIMINGQNKNSNKMDTRVGYCPQHNIFYGFLTVRQHLELFAGLRGLRGADIEKACSDALSSLRMPEKQDAWARNLSGGQKRRLNVAMACIGNPDAIILDEPTAGIDPFSRRQCWDLIHEYRPGRTIILTTHFMDEAEILGDRIAIMSTGKLRVAGSCLFLKKRFGVGYTLDVGLSGDENDQSGPATNRLLEAVKGYVPGSTILSVNFTGPTIQLPIEANHKQIATLMRMVETDGPSLGIVDFSLNSTSLSAVFIRVAMLEKEAKVDDREVTYSDNISSAEMSGDPEDPLPDIPLMISESKLLWTRFWTVYRFYFRRKSKDIAALLIHVVIPVVIVVVLAIWYNAYSYGNIPTLAFALGYTIFLNTSYLVGITAIDHNRGYKARLMLSAVPPRIYWCAFIGAEATTGFIITTISIIALSQGKMPMLNTGGSIAAATCIIFYASMLLMCIASACASWIRIGGQYIVAMYMLAFLILSVVPYFIYTIAFWNTHGRAHTAGMCILWIFRCISPHFNCLMGLYHVAGVGVYARGSDMTASSFTTSNAWSFKGEGAPLVDILFILFHIVFMSWLLYALEKGVFHRKRASTVDVGWDSDITELNPIDVDVLEEEKLAMADSTVPLCIQGVRKMYKRGKCIAVRSASFTVKQGECLGLLGLNGAGKTTVMNIAAGLLVPSEGSALLRGVNPIKNPSIIAERLALNPQHDDLFPELTVRQNIMFCAKLRGYASGPALIVWTEKYIEFYGLKEHANKTCNILSGGNKRKLNLACALVGSPDVILLDEPSAGLDPIAQYSMGRAIRETGKNSAVLYTSHCMEQAEALCSRIAIMKDGRIKAIGSLSRLKQRFSQGLVLEARVSYVTPEEVRQRAEAHDVSLSMTIHPYIVRIMGILEKLQVKTSHQNMLSTAFISNSVATNNPIVAEDLISLVLMEERKEALKLFVKDQFIVTNVVDVQTSTIIFLLQTKGGYLISEAFRKMEESCPDSAHVEDYIVKHSTLDMVFTSFAKTGTSADENDETGLIS